MPRPYIKVNDSTLELAVPNALGIGAASFWSFVTTVNRQQTTDNGIFLSEEKTKSGKRYSGKPDAKRNAQRKKL